jgi:hypothetical protein
MVKSNNLNDLNAKRSITIPIIERIKMHAWRIVEKDDDSIGLDNSMSAKIHLGENERPKYNYALLMQCRHWFRHLCNRDA